MAVIAPGLSRRRMYGSGSMAKRNGHRLGPPTSFGSQLTHSSRCLHRYFSSIGTFRYVQVPREVPAWLCDQRGLCRCLRKYPP